MTINSKTYKKILSADITPQNYIDFKNAIESAYNNYDFNEAQKGIYKLLNSDFSELKHYYRALKVCFYATHPSDNLFQPFKELFERAKSIKYLKIACSLNLLIILYLLDFESQGIFLFLIFPLNIIALVFVGGYVNYNRVILCTSCLKFTLARSINGKHFCYRCHHDLKSDLTEESITSMEKRLKSKYGSTDNLKIEFENAMTELNEFVRIFEKEKSIKRAFERMRYEF